MFCDKVKIKLFVCIFCSNVGSLGRLLLGEKLIKGVCQVIWFSVCRWLINCFLVGDGWVIRIVIVVDYFDKF